MTQIWIASQTVGSGGAASVTFSNIPQTFTHLQLRSVCQQVNNGYVSITFQNGTFNYRHYLTGNGSSAASGADTTNAPGIIGTYSTWNSSVFGVSIIDILDYTSTTKNKVFRALGGRDVNDANNGLLFFGSALYSSSTAITSMTLSAVTSNFTSGCRFDLYGIQTASATGA